MYDENQKRHTGNIAEKKTIFLRKHSFDGMDVYSEMF
jgi:hypothetical protein